MENRGIKDRNAFDERIIHYIPSEQMITSLTCNYNLEPDSKPRSLRDARLKTQDPRVKSRKSRDARDTKLITNMTVHGSCYAGHGFIELRIAVF